jgi:hypothetical protein
MIAGIITAVLAAISGVWAYIFKINRQNDKIVVEKSVLVVQKKEAEVKLEASKKTDDTLASDIDNLLHPKGGSLPDDR